MEVPKDVADTLWSLHKLWVNAVIAYESSFPEEVQMEQMKSLDFNVGKGGAFHDNT